MVKKIVLGFLVVLVLFLGYVSTRDGHFRYETSGVINAPATQIYPYISNLKKGSEWSPFDRRDPNMKKTFTGVDGQIGSTMDFDGDAKETGAGKIELTALVPNQSAKLKLTFIKPFPGESIVDYTLTPEGNGTKFTWTMSGDGGFMGKLMSVFMDCEAMVTKDFDQGIANLKQLVESKKI